jgi:hypothetical protein
MSTRQKVQECAMRVRTELSVEKKINAIADTIEEFVKYTETMEHMLRQICTKLRRMEM